MQLPHWLEGSKGWQGLEGLEGLEEAVAAEEALATDDLDGAGVSRSPG